MTEPPPSTQLLSALRQTARVLDERHQPWVLVGGLAVSIRVEPRFTRDIDLAVAVADDAVAGLVAQLTPAERRRAVEAVARIEQLGANRGRALGAELERWLGP